MITLLENKMNYYRRKRGEWARGDIALPVYDTGCIKHTIIRG
jgi:hypothetical protein